MKKLSLITVIVLFSLALSLNVMAAEHELNLGHGAARDNPRHTVAEDFAEYVEEESDGKVKIDIHPAESIGSDPEMAEQVEMGALDMSINSQGPIASYNESLNILGLPFQFNDAEEAFAVLDNNEFKEKINEELIPKNLRVLSFWDNGMRHITNSVRPIEEPKDLEGIKIRTPKDDVTLAIFEELGANPAPLAFGELYMALSQGTFDAQENPVTNIYYNDLHEAQDYLSLTNHKYESCPLVVSELTWMELPDDVKKVIEEGAQKYARKHWEENLAEQEKLIEKVEEEVEVNEANIQAMKEATEPVNEKFIPEFGEDLKEIIDETIDEQ